MALFRALCLNSATPDNENWKLEEDKKNTFWNARSMKVCDLAEQVAKVPAISH